MEALAQAGAFDGLPGIKREHFFAENTTGETFAEILLRFGGKMQTDKKITQNSLFGGSNAIAITRPEIPQVNNWSILDKLNREKKMIGMYLSAHPLDPYRLEIDNLVNTQLSDFKTAMSEGKDFAIAGLASSVRNLVDKNGNPWGIITLEDFTDSHEFRFFKKDYETFQSYFREGLLLFIKGNIQRNFRNELEPRIRTITYLSNIREETFKSVSLTLRLEQITDEWLNELNHRIEANKGNILLRFKIVDPDTNQTVELFSRKQRVNLNKEFVDYLENLGVEMKLN